MVKSALVTGCSSGIGYETALEVARRGFSTYAGVRNASKDGGLAKAASKDGLEIKIIPMDVDDAAATSTAIDSVLADSGGLDVLVNNAGYGLFGSLEDISDEDLKSQFETNFFSIARIIRQISPSMRARGFGHIVNVSSIAGKIGFPGSPAYVSSCLYVCISRYKQFFSRAVCKIQSLFQTLAFFHKSPRWWAIRR